jgi:hypothetical protein
MNGLLIVKLNFRLMITTIGTNFLGGATAVVSGGLGKTLFRPNQFYL